MDRKKRASFLALALVPFLLFCGGREATAQTLGISPDPITVKVGKTTSVRVECALCLGNDLQGFLTLSTFDPSIATVSPTNITFFSDLFAATVTVTGIAEGVTTLQVVLDFGSLVARATVSVIPDTGPECPAESALEGDPQKETKLAILRDFRDEVLANSPTGQRYIDLFYQHAQEGVKLMFSSPELLSHTYTLLEDFLPTIQSIVDGQVVTVTAADLVDIEALLEAFAEKASPELQADLRAIQEELQQGALLEQLGIRIDPEVR